MVKLCTIDNIINKISISTYMIESVYSWHIRLSLVGISTENRLIKSCLTSCDVNNFEKCGKSKKYLKNIF